MYRTYFGFTHYPFEKGIPTDQMMSHRPFLEYQKRMKFLQTHRGIGIVYGPSGSGKSAALRWLRDTLNPNRFRFYYLPDAPASSSDFYRQLTMTMDLQPAFRRVEMVRQIRDHILDLSVEKKITPWIVLDDCQMYGHPVLETLRLFMNFEIDSRHHVILLLCGQPELRKRLRYTVYEPLTQRITVQCPFEGLTPEETGKYLQHRLAGAGVKHPIFEPDACEYIYQVTKGLMRKVDTLAAHSLFLAAGLKKKTVDQPIVETALKESLWG